MKTTNFYLNSDKIWCLFLAFPQFCIVKYDKLQKGDIFSGRKKSSRFHQSSYFLKIFKITCRLMELHIGHFWANSPTPRSQKSCITLVHDKIVFLYSHKKYTELGFPKLKA